MRYFNVWSSDASEMMVSRDRIALKDDIKTENGIINIFDEVTFQEILGFGGAFTESSAFNYSLLDDDLKHELIKAYFDSDTGLGYRFCRTHINSCDFSLKKYTYTDKNDRELKSFSVAHDEEYVMPFVRDALAYTGDDMFLFASPWSPPSWMKDSKKMIFGGKLLWDYAESWAEYFVRYIQEYEKSGIKISGLTIQNEPNAVQTWESCFYTAEDEARFVCDYLFPALDRAGLSDIKVMVWDHNKERIYDRTRDIFKNAAARERVWGVGFHWYSGSHFDGLDLVKHQYPDKKLIATEFCCGGTGGSYRSAFSYASDMLGNLNHYMSASVDWNMILDTSGGPYHSRVGGCQAPVTVDPKTRRFTLEPTYYAIAHFSRFIKKGAVRIGQSAFTENIKTAAFKNPDGSIAAVILNTSDKGIKASVRFENQTAPLYLNAMSINTIVFKK